MFGFKNSSEVHSLLVKLTPVVEQFLTPVEKHYEQRISSLQALEAKNPNLKILVPMLLTANCLLINQNNLLGVVCKNLIKMGDPLTKEKYNTVISNLQNACFENLAEVKQAYYSDITSEKFDLSTKERLVMENIFHSYILDFNKLMVSIILVPDHNFQEFRNAGHDKFLDTFERYALQIIQEKFKKLGRAA